MNIIAQSILYIKLKMFTYQTLFDIEDSTSKISKSNIGERIFVKRSKQKFVYL